MERYDSCPYHHAIVQQMSNIWLMNPTRLLPCAHWTEGRLGWRRDWITVMQCVLVWDWTECECEAVTSYIRKLYSNNTPVYQPGLLSRICNDNQPIIAQLWERVIKNRGSFQILNTVSADLHLISFSLISLSLLSLSDL